MQSDFEFFDDCQSCFIDDKDVHPPSNIDSSDAQPAATAGQVVDKQRPRKRRQIDAAAREAERKEQYEEKRQYRERLLASIDRLIDKL